ncbi:expressed protein [Phakopsora pachyrhizi]|uniref:Expressed protein n=1 Tax=Phakopsora pachyrhizi TaxID=170000 RepID=A0AAV0BWW2_PHAPC|nr:expressed protein [Phakopsora pachyrhizi]
MLDLLPKSNSDISGQNSKGISNLQQNIHDDNQNHILTTTNPVNKDCSNQMAKKHNNWEAEDISLIHEWHNPSSPPESAFLFENPYEIQHGGSVLPHSVFMKPKNLINQPSNFQEELNFYFEGPWNSELAEDLADPFHRKEFYPHEGSSKDQTLSSNTNQHKFDGDLHDGIHITSVPNFDEFWSLNPFFLPLENPNLQITHDEPMPEYPAFHFTQNDLWNSPHFSEIGNRVYLNQDSEVLYPKPASSSHNSDSINTVKYVENDNLIDGTEKKHEALKTELELESKEELIKQRKDLINVLMNHYNSCSRGIAQNYVTEKNYGFMSVLGLKLNPEKEAKYKNFIGRKALNFIEKKAPKRGRKKKLGVRQPFEKADTSAISKRKRRKIMDYLLHIKWKDSESLIEKIHEIAYDIEKHTKEELLEGNPRDIENISVMGVNIIKIIAEKYPENEKLGDDESLINYTTNFWKFCLSKNRKMEDILISFFGSIKENTSEESINRFISTKFTKNDKSPDKIFSSIRFNIKENLNVL